jgi:ribosomal protein S18 acetylase RimI-like enzyme
MQFTKVDLNNPDHCTQLIKLLNDYMLEPMGNNQPMDSELAPQIISGLKNYQGYLGFFAIDSHDYIALANCNQNFSTFKAKPILNIHDFIVTSVHRGKGVGVFLMNELLNYAEKNGFCRVNLEVRTDNSNAKALYQKLGFAECEPSMHFWERKFVDV